MSHVMKRIANLGLIPVATINDADKALPLAEALIQGGLACMEVTFRTAQGESAIRRVAARYPDLLMGAGTILSTDQADRAIQAGAQFIVSPGLNPEVVTYCQRQGVAVLPGCSSPSDMECALGLGLDAVKLFPAEQLGGLAYIKAVSAPYPSLRFIPTGGINLHNLASYLSYSKVLACGGSWMVKSSLIEERQFAEITRLCQEALQAVHGFELAHVGINMQSEAMASEVAGEFQALFDFPARQGGSSVFAAECIEIMKAPYLGTHGHIAIAVNHMDRAVHLLHSKGYAFREDTKKVDAQGRPKAIYLQKEIGGFAVHLVQKQ